MATTSLLFILYIFLYIPHSLCQECTINSTNTRTTSTTDQTLSTTTKLLLSLTQSFRNSFFPSTDFTRLRNDIHSFYVGDQDFTEFTFLSTAVHYCSDTQFLAAFVLLITILLPVVLSVLWCLWSKCSVSDDDIVNDEDLPNKHLSVAAQVVSWCLACAIIILLMIMVSLAAMLIIGDTIVGQAVRDSDTAVRSTLPTISSLHGEFIEAVNRSLVMGYRSVNESIYANELRYINNMLAGKINSSLPYSRVEGITKSVINDIITSMTKTHAHLIGLILFHELYSETLNTSHSLANHINNKISDVIKVCNDSIDYDPCANIIASHNNVTINTTVHQLFSTNNTNILTNILNTIEGISNTLTAANITERITTYNELLNEIEVNVSEHVVYRTGVYFTPIHNNVSTIVSEVFGRYGDIDYGLPESQELVEDALSNRYLSNWDEFRSLFTIAFSLSFLVFLVGISLTIVRGIINACGIYMYGDDTTYTNGAHLAAIMLKNFVTWVAIVGVVSSFFFVFILCLASLIGRGCGNHGNYSDLIDDVIDNNQTWGGVYPLGLTYFDDPAHPLTLSSIISSCSKGYTAAKSLQLSQLINLNSMIPSTDEQINYFDNMKSIASSLTFSDYPSILGTELTNSLLHYNTTIAIPTYPWAQYNELAAEDVILNTSLNKLYQQLLDIVTNSSFNDSSIPPSDQDSLYDTINDTLTLIHILNHTLIQYETGLTQARSNVSELLTVWERVPNTTSNLITDSNQLRAQLVQTVDDIVKKYTVTIATNTSATMVTSLMTYVNDLYCNVSICYPLVLIFDNFTDATCSRMVNGLDIYWSVLLLVFITSNITLVLIMTLACHLADKEMLRKSNNSKIPKPYHHSDHIISQLTSVAWLVLSFGVNLWFTVAIATDAQFTCDDVSTTLCCTSCYWVFGGSFLLICFILCSVLKVYQLIVLRRIRVYRGGGKAQQVQRYWLVRLRATVFYEGLMLFFMMYIPFTAITGSYITTRGVPTPPSFAALVLSLSGIMIFIVSIIKERNQVMEYVNLIQQTMSLNLCRNKNNDGSAPSYPVTNNSPTNGDVITGNGGVANRSNDIQLTVIPEGDHTHFDDARQYEPQVETVQVPVIMEDNEGAGLEAETEFINDDESIIMGDSSQVPDLHENGIIEESNDQDEGIPLSSVLLDGLHNEGGVMAGTRQSTDVSTRHRVGGVRLAHSYLSQQTDGSTPRSSLYMSEDSVTTGGGSELPPYYQSSSHVPGYTSTDDSSYRDDYDSYESDYTTNYYNEGQIDSKQVEV